MEKGSAAVESTYFTGKRTVLTKQTGIVSLKTDFFTSCESTCTGIPRELSVREAGSGNQRSN